MIESTEPTSLNFKASSTFRKVLITILLIIITGILGSGVTWLILHEKYKNKIITIQVQADKELGTCKIYTIREHRLECMIRTIMTAYKLSKW